MISTISVVSGIAVGSSLLIVVLWRFLLLKKHYDASILKLPHLVNEKALAILTSLPSPGKINPDKVSDELKKPVGVLNTLTKLYWFLVLALLLVLVYLVIVQKVFGIV